MEKLNSPLWFCSLCLSFSLPGSRLLQDQDKEGSWGGVCVWLLCIVVLEGSIDLVYIQQQQQPQSSRAAEHPSPFGSSIALLSPIHVVFLLHQQAPGIIPCSNQRRPVIIQDSEIETKKNRDPPNPPFPNRTSHYQQERQEEQREKEEKKTETIHTCIGRASNGTQI